MARFSSNEVIEAKRLAPKVSTEEGGDFIAWLGEYGYGHAVEPDGGITIFDPKAMVEVLIKKGQWAYFHPSPADDQPTDALTVVDHADFQGNWEKTGTGG